MARLPLKYLIEREGIASLFFLIFCTALALKLPAGVGTSTQAPSVSHAVAPWIFGPFQVLLLYLPPWFGALAFPIIFIIVLAGLPWLAVLWSVKSVQRIFMILSGTVIVLLLWFMVKELWWA